MFTLLLIGLLGGAITGVSPCVLPVLPAVFLAGGTRRALSPQPTGTTAAPVPATPGVGRRRPYWVVAGLALSFGFFTLSGTLILAALHLPQGLIRWTGLVLLVLMGIGMIFPAVESVLEQPFARIPQLKISAGGHGNRAGFVLGLALGAVYVPCAGPVLAPIIVAGATGHIGTPTVVLTVAFAVGTAIPLLFFALAGRRVAERVRVFRTRQRGLRIGAGAVVIALAVALAFNVTDFLQRVVPDYTSSLGTAVGADVADKAAVEPDNPAFDLCSQDLRAVLLGCGPAPEIAGISQWFNTADNAPLSISGLRGKVVLVDFWAYSCINCQRAIPHVNAWYAAYRAAGLEVIGVHTPEYAFEHEAANVEAGAERLGITYPVALDNDYATWDNYSNQSWPADYLVDATGQVRHISVGEGRYAATEALIRQLLQTAHPGMQLPARTVVDDDTPISEDQTPETYLGAARAQNFVGRPALSAGTRIYRTPATVAADSFALAGIWNVNDESITAAGRSTITLDFTAQDVYLDVGGHGTITTTANGKTSSQPVSGAPNIYTVIHQDKDRRGTVTVSLSAGLSAYSFTFG
ncbi:Cytochrome c biogenesis protein CcdA [Nakamurella panacisegetis]|uniref:Cytochrome c biogenesis protein CcdA n=1 Tax=Nakamurella panacisegetis TaxID=1090615 RepID=A0A1H0JS24_9ACTN|nr:cytochrome c biogenesis protein DipZ [Nakamurella panacisegetis]SDO46211.1 Cytochrome c biogenesis protein CcdA [Nakamurella panacisegetis]